MEKEKSISKKDSQDGSVIYGYSLVVLFATTMIGNLVASGKIEGAYYWLGLILFFFCLILKTSVDRIARPLIEMASKT